MASRKKNGYYSKTIVHKDLVIIPDPNQPSTSKVKLKEGGGITNELTCKNRTRLELTRNIES